MSDLEYAITKLIQEQQPITESEARDLAYLITQLPEFVSLQKFKSTSVIDEEELYDDEDDRDDDRYDDDDLEDKRYEQECENAYRCTCGAWQFNKNNHPVHVADCICGNT